MKSTRNLINYNTNTDNLNIILEQYKLFVESAQRISENRIQAVNFLIAILSGLLVGATAFFDNSLMRTAISIFGIIISLVSIMTVCRYRQLNRIKFKIIHEIENLLPINLFCLESDRTSKLKSLGFTKLEILLFILFAVGYLLLALYKESAPNL